LGGLSLPSLLRCFLNLLPMRPLYPPPPLPRPPLLSPPPPFLPPGTGGGAIPESFRCWLYLWCADQVVFLRLLRTCCTLHLPVSGALFVSLNGGQGSRA
jgi:hypothetical protein